MFDLMGKSELAALAGMLMLAAAAWVVILRRQVRAKTEEVREWLRREAALTETYRDLLENAIDVVYTRDLEGNFTSVNNTAVRALGYSRQELLSMNIKQIIAPDDWDSAQGFLARSVEGAKINDAEFEVIAKDGARLAMEIRSRLLYEGGKTVGVQGIARNVTERKKAEEELALLKHSIDVYYDGAYWTDVKNRIFYANDAGCKALGYTREELIGKAMGEVVPAASTERLQGVWEALRSRGYVSFEAIHRRKDGSEFPVELVITYVHFGGKEYACGFARDVTERRSIESRLRLQSAALQAAANGIVITNRDGNILWVNPGFTTLTGYSREAAIGQSTRIMKSNHHPASFYADLWKTVLGGKVWHGELTNRRKDGTLYEEEMTITPVRDETGDVTHFIAIKQDITQRKWAEKALRESEEGLAAAQRIAHVGSWYWNAQTDIAHWSEETFRIFGLPPVDLENHREVFLAMVHPEDRSRVAQSLADGLSETCEYNIDYRLQMPDGKVKVIHAQGEVLRDADGKVFGMRGINHDITDRERVETALRESEERFRSLFENATVGIYRTTPAGHVLLANPALIKMLGYDNLDDLVKRNLEEQGFEPSYPRKLFHERMAREGEVKDVESVWTRQDGTAMFVRESARAIRGQGNQILSYDGIVEDITERRLAEEMLQESEERFRQLAENVEEVLLLFDPQLNKVFYVSPAYEKVWGRSCESLYASPRSFLAGIHPDDRPIIAASMEQTSRSRGEWEYRVIRPNGTLRWVWDRAFPIRDSAGRVVRIAELVQDITERKQVEVATHKAMRASEDANRAKSEFLANMSHELRTPMNAVIGMTELALATELNSEQRHYLELVESSADSLLELINHILDFSKLEAGKLELEVIPFVVEDVMEEALRPLATQAFRKGLEMACAVDRNIPRPLWGDPIRLKQVVTNLVENAIKFTERGEVVIRAEVDSKTETDLTLAISVTDTGVGIPDDKISMVFEAFTQADGSATRRFEGAGLGLAICSELVRMMDGSISVESGPERGSTFRVIVRVGIAEDQSLPRRLEIDRSWAGLPVLLVDDHTATREILAEILRSWGMIPHLASSGQAALAVIRKAQSSPSPIRLALIDAHLPDCDGWAFAEEARQITGFFAPILMLVPPTEAGPDAQRRRELGIVDYLSKPVWESDLVKRIAKALETGWNGNAPATDSGSKDTPASILRVLLAESNEVTQVLVTHLLEKRGHQVFAAEDMRQVVSALEDGRDIDIVLMDTEISDANGLEAARAIREIDRKSGRRTPIIAMTGNPTKGEEEACVAAEIDDYLAKPVRPAALFESIRRVIALPSAAATAKVLLRCVR